MRRMFLRLTICTFQSSKIPFVRLGFHRKVEFGASSHFPPARNNTTYFERKTHTFVSKAFLFSEWATTKACQSQYLIESWGAHLAHLVFSPVSNLIKLYCAFSLISYCCVFSRIMILLLLVREKETVLPISGLSAHELQQGLKFF